MKMENMKNMVVLKNLPSNIVEEAIVILKPNVKVKSLNSTETTNSKGNKPQNNQKYIINEAEMLISNYISKIEKNEKNVRAKRRISINYKKLKKIAIYLGILLFTLCLILV